jgi:hypothetical protein
LLDTQLAAHPQGFRSWIKAIGADTAKANETFRRIDVDDNGTLDLNELADAVRGYHVGPLDVSLLGAKAPAAPPELRRY